MSNQRINNILAQNDRRGEVAIALLQGSMALFVFLMHIVSSYKNSWESLSLATICVSAAILFTSLIRMYFSEAEKNLNFYSHCLTILDGILIYTLILTYNLAYNLPVEATFKSPTIVFLIIYVVSRILRSDPWAVLVAGGTAIFGWLSVYVAAVISGAQMTNSYAEFVSSEKLLAGAVFELALGLAIIALTLAIYARNARRFVAQTAHIEDLATANLKAEESIKNFEKLLESSVDGVLIVDRYGMIERVNPAIESLFEYQSSELIGNSVALLMSEDNAQLLRLAIAHYLETKESHLVGHRFESTGLKKDGTEFDIELSISEFSASGEIRFAGFVRDTSAKTQALASEKRAKAQFQNAINAAMDAIIIINQSGEILNFNPAAEGIFGHSFENVAGKKLSDVIVPHRYRDAHNKGMQHYIRTGEGPVLDSRIEIEGLHADGHEIPIELAIREIEGASGNLFIGYARDITERKSFEEQILAAKNAAEMATRAKTSFLAMMSHEIRTPLNGILGIHGLLSETELDSDQRQLMGTATESGEALLTIINDLLDFSKLEAGKFEIEKRPFDLAALIESVANLIKPHADEKELSLSHQVDASVGRHLFGDAGRIRQILLNLCWNAIKFTQEGRVEIKIQQLAENRIRFSVEDTGTGIAEDKHGDLFTEFASIDADYANKFGGTGLGLTICKALVENMGGEIGFASQLGSGSNFWFELELEPISDPTENNFDVPSARIEKGSLSGLKVLIADDNKTNQLVTSRYLKYYGCDYEFADDGVEALGKIESSKFDLILMDISMPEMNGYEATAEIRNLPDREKAALPIIAFTAYAGKDDQERIAAAGMDGFIPKPFNREQFGKTILESVDFQPAMLETIEPLADRNRLAFDYSVLDLIMEDMSESEVSDAFGKFAADLKRYVSTLDEGVEKRDKALLERATHGLKGVSAMFGATELSEMASAMNHKCLKPDQINVFEEAAELMLCANDIIQQTSGVEAHYRQKNGSVSHE